MIDSTFKLLMAAGIVKPTSRTDYHQNRMKMEKQNIKEKRKRSKREERTEKKTTTLKGGSQSRLGR